MASDLPGYFIADGLGGAWATYTRSKDGRSLHRVKSIDLPVRQTRDEAQADLAFWLHRKAAAGRVAERAEYRRQLDRMKAEIVAEGGTPDPRDTGVPYGG